MDARTEILNRIKEQEAKRSNPLSPPDWEGEALKPVEGDLVAAFCKALQAVDGTVGIANDRNHLQQLVSAFIQDNKRDSMHMVDPRIAQWLGVEKPVSENKIHKNIHCQITGCEVLVAQTGSVFMASNMPGGRKTWAYPPVHVVVATKSQVVPTINDAMRHFETKYGSALPSQITLVTGSSRTADIEKTLVKGAHGPVKLAVFIINDNFN